MTGGRQGGRWWWCERAAGTAPSFNLGLDLGASQMVPSPERGRISDCKVHRGMVMVMAAVRVMATAIAMACPPLGTAVGCGAAPLPRAARLQPNAAEPCTPFQMFTGRLPAAPPVVLLGWAGPGRPREAHQVRSRRGVARRCALRGRWVRGGVRTSVAARAAAWPVDCISTECVCVWPVRPEASPKVDRAQRGHAVTGGGGGRTDASGSR